MTRTPLVGPGVTTANSPVDEDVWREAVAIANIPTLLPVLVQMTGDRRWLEDPYRPSRTQGLGDDDSGGLPDHLQDQIRDAALGAVLEWQAGKPLAIPAPSDELLVEMMSVSLGGTVPCEYAPMISHERGVADERRSSNTQGDAADPPPGFSVLIVGAGVSGPCTNTVWTHPGMDTYYRNSKGRVVVNNPFKIIDYWQMTDTASLDDYRTGPRRS